MKARSLVLIVFAFIIIVPACTKKTDTIKIALLLGNMHAARWKKDKDNFLIEAKKMGCEAEVLDANFSESTQYSQAVDLINRGFKTLVIGAVNSTTGAAIVRLANKNNVHTIAYDGIIENCPLDYIISFNDKEIGVLMAQYALSKAKSGNYVIIGGDKANINSTQIRNGEEEVLSEYLKDGRIKISYGDYAEKWSRDEAYMIMKQYLKLSANDRPVAVLVSSDNMTQGVINAFLEANISIPIITGQDASLLGCQNIMCDRQAMTVYKPVQKLAAMAANLAFKLAKGEIINDAKSTINNGFVDVPVVHVGILSVDKNNIESTVVADGFEKKEDIMKMPQP
jgi:D-xylose transport system substrate-binding protein